MDNKKEIEKIIKAAEEKKLCAVWREYIDTYSLYGFPTKVGDELIAIDFIYDFRWDGYKIIRKADVTEVICGEDEAFLQKITQNEYKEYEPKEPALDISSMKSALESLYKSKKTVTIECEDFEGSELYMGQIAGFEKGAVLLRTFSGVGIWDKKYTKIDINDVTCVSVDNSYARIITGYLKEEK